MDRQTQMTVFVHAVRDGSFSAAARALGMTPSAISKQISALEDRLSVRLINRTTRTLHLTEAGTAYFESCQKILNDIEEAEQDISGLRDLPRGRLRITAPIVLGSRHIPGILGPFQEKYPDIEVDLDLSDKFTDLVGEGFDLGLRTGSLIDSSMIARKICPIERPVCASPDYLFRHGLPKTPDDLAKHACLEIQPIDHLNEWPFINCPGKKTIKVRGKFKTSNGEAQLYGALAGMGIIRVADFLVGPRLRDGRLVEILQEFRPPTKTFLWAMYPPTRYVPVKVRVFIDFLVETCTPAPPWIQYDP